MAAGGRTLRAAFVVSTLANLGLGGVLLFGPQSRVLHDPAFLEVRDADGRLRMWKYQDRYDIIDSTGRMSAGMGDRSNGIWVGSTDAERDLLEYVWSDGDADGRLDIVVDLTGDSPVAREIVIGEPIDQDDEYGEGDFGSSSPDIPGE